MHKLIASTLLLAVLSAGSLFAEKKLIQPKEFPKGRPFSPGIQVGNTLYVAGMIGNDLKTGKIPESFEDEVKQTLENIAIVVKEAGFTFADAVSVNVYLTDMELFPRMNPVYVKFFPDPKPVRTTVGTPKLAAAGAHIEITVTLQK